VSDDEGHGTPAGHREAATPLATRLRPLRLLARDDRHLLELLDRAERGRLAVYVRACAFAHPPGREPLEDWTVTTDRGHTYARWTPDGDSFLRLAGWRGTLADLADGAALTDPCELEAPRRWFPDLYRDVDANTLNAVVSIRANRTPLRPLGVSALLADPDEVDPFAAPADPPPRPAGVTRADGPADDLPARPRRLCDVAEVHGLAHLLDLINRRKLFAYCTLTRLDPQPDGWSIFNARPVQLADGTTADTGFWFHACYATPTRGMVRVTFPYGDWRDLAAGGTVGVKHVCARPIAGTTFRNLAPGTLAPVDPLAYPDFCLRGFTPVGEVAPIGLADLWLDADELDALGPPSVVATAVTREPSTQLTQPDPAEGLTDEDRALFERACTLLRDPKADPEADVWHLTGPKRGTPNRYQLARALLGDEDKRDRFRDHKPIGKALALKLDELWRDRFETDRPR